MDFQALEICHKFFLFVFGLWLIRAIPFNVSCPLLGAEGENGLRLHQMSTVTNTHLSRVEGTQLGWIETKSKDFIIQINHTLVLESKGKYFQI